MRVVLIDDADQVLLDLPLAPSIGVEFVHEILRVAHRRAMQFHPVEVKPHPLDCLSKRERQVFDLIVQGFMSENIAANLGLSLRTVETHRAHINRKLGVSSTGELIRYAAMNGLLVLA